MTPSLKLDMSQWGSTACLTRNFPCHYIDNNFHLLYSQKILSKLHSYFFYWILSFKWYNNYNTYWLSKQLTRTNRTMICYEFRRELFNFTFKTRAKSSGGKPILLAEFRCGLTSVRLLIITFAFNEFKISPKSQWFIIMTLNHNAQRVCTILSTIYSFDFTYIGAIRVY